MARTGNGGEILRAGRYSKIHKQHFEEGTYRITERIAEEAKQRVPQSAQRKKGRSGEEPEKSEKAEQNAEMLSYERVLVEDCAICDSHGFLLAIQGYPQVRRESCVKFSFAVPYIVG
uniref:Uncharacterized protein n=1 Tax=Thermofilum pendens TaxID=2269 RepID=A0A7C4B9B9_THEPE